MKKYIVIILFIILFFMGHVCAEDSNSTEIKVDSNTQEIYVSDVGDDLNSGSVDSPYASIGKALSNVNESDDTTIYLSKGTFSSDDDVNFVINLNHRIYGGNLNFIGSGIDGTIIDGQSAFRFATLSENTTVSFKNLTFVNFKGDVGGTLYSNGILNVDHCCFKNSYSTGNCGGAIYSKDKGKGVNDFFYSFEYISSLSVKDSQFINCSVNGDSNFYNQGGGSIYAFGIDYFYLENNTFFNNKITKNCVGVSILLESNLDNDSKSYIINNKFINLIGLCDASLYIISKNSTIENNIFINCSNPSSDYSIVYLNGNFVFKNNTFLNSTNGVGNIYSKGTFYPFKSVSDNISIGNFEINNGLDLIFNFTDDNGNVVKKDSVLINFYSFNSSFSYMASKKNGVFHIDFDNMPDVGYYAVECNGVYVSDAIINYSYAPVDLWVSPKGHDGNDGQFNSPFLTIQHGIDVGFDKSFNVVLHLKDGVYSDYGNVELDFSNKGFLKIIGETFNKTIIDGNGENWFFNVNSNLFIENLVFRNGYSNYQDLIYCGNGKVSIVNSIVVNNTVEDNYILNNVIFDNLSFVNNLGNIHIKVTENTTFSNSNFVNNHNIYGSYGVLVIGSEGVTISNCKFINNSANKCGAAISSGFRSFISIDNYYEGNSAMESGLFYVDSAKFINDTYINNKATSGNFAIVGVKLDDSSKSVYNFDNCKFINNSAIKGGAIGIKQGSIVNCLFINNTAKYGGAIVIIPNKKPSLIFSQRKYDEINFTNSTFIDNFAEINGKDIFLEDYPLIKDYKIDLISLNITFLDKTVKSFHDILNVIVEGPSGAIVGGGKFDLKLNGEIIATAIITNGIVSFDYYGFENGTYNFSGETLYASNSSSSHYGKISVNQENSLNNYDIWVSDLLGSDDADGSEFNPFKSISKAISVGYNNSRNVVVHICDGTYVGELNALLEISSMYNITLKGNGVNKTVIDGGNLNYFARITNGNNSVKFSDLTIRNMLPCNIEKICNNSKISVSSISEITGRHVSPIIIENGANLYLNNIVITKCHGGKAIIENYGNLFVNNSTFTFNGISYYGLVFGGTVLINNSVMMENFGGTSFLYAADVLINNSIINNAFNVVNYYTLIRGNCIVENSMISNDGDFNSLSGLDYNNKSSILIPALSIDEGNVFLNNVSVVCNFKGDLFESQLDFGSGSQLSVLGYLYASRFSREIFVYNSNFVNFKYLWCINTHESVNYNFYDCVFNNVSLIAQSQTLGENSRFSISNSVFLNSGQLIDRYNRADREDPFCVFENNYWASNDKPVINFVNPGKATSFEPKNWVVLNDVGGILKLQLTDGINAIDYNGDLPLSIHYSLNDGEMVPVITVCGKSYPLIIEGNNIMVDSNPIVNPVLKPVADNTILASDVTLTFGQSANFTARFLQPWGDPLVNAEVTFNINDRNYTAVTDANGIAGVGVSLNAGAYNVVTTNPVSKQVNVNTIVVNKLASVISALKVSTVYNGGKYLVITLRDANNVALEGRDISVVLNGKTIKGKTDAKGQFKVSTNALVPKTYTAAITFEGDNNYKPSTATVKVVVSKATAKLTAKKATFKAKTKTKKYTITLKDNKGKVMKKAKVTLKVNKKTYKATTNAKGKATFKITKLTKKGTFNAVVKYAGNKNFKAIYKIVKLAVKK